MARIDEDGLVIASARSAVLDRFRWESGHADVWRIFADAEAFAAIVAGLVEPWRASGVTKVLGIESRGFLLAGAAALQLASGFVAVRKSDGLLPGPKLTVETESDYRGRRHRLRMQAILTPGDRVLLVDDWAERGSQALAARQLVEATDATFLGAALLVDQLTSSTRAALGTTTALVAQTNSHPPPTKRAQVDDPPTDCDWCESREVFQAWNWGSIYRS